MDTSHPIPHSSPSYKGRFAPSPTGPLHFGSLVTAVGSFLDARAHGGQWLLRMEDLDPLRESPGAADTILRSLDAFGLHWDGALLYQHSRLDAYQAAVERLRAAGLTFPCACSRTEIADSSLWGVEGPVYPGTCRHGLPPGKPARAIRLRVADGEILSFDDALQSQVRQHLAKEVGDFVIRRADGRFAYQLAVVLDDALQGITHVVRGADLLLSTPRQLYLQGLLHLPTLFSICTCRWR
ncbi:MAG: tRNA glutamyl-Q(34) synthetase GluQRS [Gammaproteobacteria bacterium]